jgi:hypothetical protein
VKLLTLKNALSANGQQAEADKACAPEALKDEACGGQVGV